MLLIDKTTIGYQFGDITDNLLSTRTTAFQIGFLDIFLVDTHAGRQLGCCRHMTGKELPSNEMHSECEDCRRGALNSEEHIWVFIAVLSIENHASCAWYARIKLNMSHFNASALALANRQVLGD